MKKSKTPEAVNKAAAYLVDRFGGSVEFVGKVPDGDLYVYASPDDMDVSFPVVFVWNGEAVVKVSEFNALDLLGSVSKNS